MPHVRGFNPLLAKVRVAGSNPVVRSRKARSRGVSDIVGSGELRHTHVHTYRQETRRPIEAGPLRRWALVAATSDERLSRLTELSSPGRSRKLSAGPGMGSRGHR